MRHGDILIVFELEIVVKQLLLKNRNPFLIVNLLFDGGESIFFFQLDEHALSRAGINIKVRFAGKFAF
jgi:hypothetical protein